MKPKDYQSIIFSVALGLALLVAPTQNSLASYHPLPSLQKKKTAVATNKKKNAKRKTTSKNSRSKTLSRRYSQKELNRIMRILEKKFLSEDKTPAWRNVVGFGLGANSIDVMLKWNTKEKQQEFRKQIYNSPAIKFEGKLCPVIDNKTGVSSYQGISLQTEKPSYPLNTTEIKYTITNHSGKKVLYGERYYITTQGKDGNWFIVPTDCAFNDVGYELSHGQSSPLTAHLFPDILPNKPGIYRLFSEMTIEGKKVLFMTTFSCR